MAERSQVYARFNAPRYGRTPTLLPGAPPKTELSLEPGTLRAHIPREEHIEIAHRAWVTLLAPLPDMDYATASGHCQVPLTWTMPLDRTRESPEPPLVTIKWTLREGSVRNGRAWVTLLVPQPAASYMDYATGQGAGESRTAIGNNKVDTARRQRSQW